MPHNKRQGKAILTDEQKLERFEELGIERVIFPSFREIADMPAEAFMQDILQNRLHAEVLSCGYDYTFGKCAAGDVKVLKSFCTENGISLNILPRWV